MSHFAVLVIGENVEQQLAPYHEFECTGTDDQYVQDIDETDEKREEFKSATRSMVRCPDGTLVSRLDDQFFRDPTEEESKDMGALAGMGWSGGKFHTSKDWGDGRGYRPKIHHIPEGHEQVEVPFDNFRDYLRDYCGIPEVSIDNPLDLADKHKYHYTRIVNGEVEKVIRRTNPNKQWDWWVLGGRWSGFLKLHPGAIGKLGRKGLMGSCAADGPWRADEASKGNIDFDGMRDEAGQEATVKWGKAVAAKIAAGLASDATWDDWKTVRERNPGAIDAAREEYHAQPALKAVREAFDNPFFNADQFLTDRETYIQQARDQATVLYGVVKDGQWIAKGEMGWFGMSDDKVEQGDWNRRVNELLDGLPDDTLITVVDCHI